eukprot:gene12699-15932_t
MTDGLLCFCSTDELSIFGPELFNPRTVQEIELDVYTSSNHLATYFESMGGRISDLKDCLEAMSKAYTRIPAANSTAVTIPEIPSSMAGNSSCSFSSLFDGLNYQPDAGSASTAGPSHFRSARDCQDMMAMEGGDFIDKGTFIDTSRGSGPIGHLHAKQYTNATSPQSSNCAPPMWLLSDAMANPVETGGYECASWIQQLNKSTSGASQQMISECCHMGRAPLAANRALNLNRSSTVPIEASLWCSGHSSHSGIHSNNNSSVYVTELEGLEHLKLKPSNPSVLASPMHPPGMEPGTSAAAYISNSSEHANAYISNTSERANAYISNASERANAYISNTSECANAYISNASEPAGPLRAWRAEHISSSFIICSALIAFASSTNAIASIAIRMVVPLSSLPLSEPVITSCSRKRLAALEALSTEAQKSSGTSEALSTEAPKSSGTSEALSTEAQKSSGTSEALSTEAPKSSGTSEALSTEAPKSSGTSEALSTEAQKSSGTSEALSTEAPKSSGTSEALSTEAPKSSGTRQPLSTEAPKSSGTSEALSSTWGPKSSS